MQAKLSEHYTSNGTPRYTASIEDDVMAKYSDEYSTREAAEKWLLDMVTLYKAAEAARSKV